VQLAVAAYSGEPPRGLAAEAEAFVGELARLCPRATLFLGGYRGLMRVVADAALQRGLRVVMVIPKVYEGDVFPGDAIVVRTGLDVRERSSILVRSGEALAVLGGGIGTLFEALIACSYGIPVHQLVAEEALLTSRLARCFPEGVLDPRVGCRIAYHRSGRELAQAVCGRGSRGGAQVPG